MLRKSLAGFSLRQFVSRHPLTPTPGEKQITGLAAKPSGAWMGPPGPTSLARPTWPEFQRLCTIASYLKATEK